MLGDYIFRDEFLREISVPFVSGKEKRTSSTNDLYTRPCASDTPVQLHAFKNDFNVKMGAKIT